MFRNTFYVGRFFGIPVRIHISWLIVFVLLTWSLAEMWFPSHYKDWSTGLYWEVAVATSILFFASVLAHELAHSVLARHRGLKVRDIVLFIFGGVSEIPDESKTPGAEFWIAVVGPGLSIAVGGIFALAGYALAPVSPPLSAIGLYLGLVNVFLGVFNLIPGFPLDGGRVLRSILWKVGGDPDRATRWAARFGQVIAYLFIFVGIYQAFRGNFVGGLWLAFIGWFLDNAALSSYRQVFVKHFLAGHRVQEIMTRECPTVAPDMPVHTLVEQYFLPYPFRCLLVTSGERTEGIVNIQGLRHLPRAEWNSADARRVMVPMEKVMSARSDDDLWSVLTRMTAEEVSQFPVIDDGKVVGFLSQADILRFLRHGPYPGP